MKNITLRAAVLGALVAAVGLVAVPAYAGPDDYECSQTVSTSEDRTGDALVGVCVDAETGTGIDGGGIEVGRGDGAGDNGGTYVVIEGDADNEQILSGYAGLSNYETGGAEREDGGTECTGTGSGTNEGTNSGGCIDPLVGGIGLPDQTDAVPTPVCGHSTGDWDDTNRNGCSAT